MDVLRTLSTAGGQALRAGTSALAALRPAAKPLHPEGSVCRAVLRRHGSSPPSGSPWIDGTGRDEVLVRESRSVGLPAAIGDIFGLAIRVPRGDGGHGDLLFSTTGRSALGRFVLLPARSLGGRPMTTLLPYRSPAGALVLSAVYRDTDAVTLSWATGTGGWTDFATLDLPPGHEHTTDESVDFDPVRNTLPGLAQYAWVERLREPAYATARRSRHH